MMNVLHGVVMNTTGTTADAFGDPIDVRDATGLSIQLQQTGTLTGPVYLQGSNNYKVDGETATWVTLDDSDGNAVVIGTFAGAAFDDIANISDVRVAFVRLFYDDTSGTGAIKAVACVKGGC
jgi:hypothetical protein